jgi:hypothetical protein
MSSQEKVFTRERNEHFREHRAIVRIHFLDLTHIICSNDTCVITIAAPHSLFLKFLPLESVLRLC